MERQVGYASVNVVVDLHFRTSLRESPSLSRSLRIRVRLGLSSEPGHDQGPFGARRWPGWGALWVPSRRASSPWVRGRVAIQEAFHLGQRPPGESRWLSDGSIGSRPQRVEVSQRFGYLSSQLYRQGPAPRRRFGQHGQHGQRDQRCLEELVRRIQGQHPSLESDFPAPRD